MLQIHVILSLVGILSGLVVLYRLLFGGDSGAWTALFLITTILTSLSGFPLPPFGFDPPRAVGVLSLVLLLGAVVAYYAFHLEGIWRLDLCRLRGRRALSQCVRPRRAGVLEGPVPARPGADRVRAAVRDHPRDRAADFHRAWRISRNPFPPLDRGGEVSAGPADPRRSEARASVGFSIRRTKPHANFANSAKISARKKATELSPEPNQ